MGQNIVFPVRLSADKENGHSNNEMMMVLFYKFKEFLSSIRDHRKKVGKQGSRLHLQIY